MLTSTNYKSTIRNTFIKNKNRKSSDTNIWNTTDTTDTNIADLSYNCMKQNYLNEKIFQEQIDFFDSTNLPDTFDGSLLPWSSVPDSNKEWKRMVQRLEKEKKVLQYQIRKAETFQNKIILQQLRKSNENIMKPLWKAVIDKRIKELLALTDQMSTTDPSSSSTEGLSTNTRTTASNATGLGTNNTRTKMNEHNIWKDIMICLDKTVIII